MRRKLLFILTLVLLPVSIWAQDTDLSAFENGMAIPVGNTWKIGHKWDRKYQTVMTEIIMPEIYVYPPMKFKNKRQREKYSRLVRNVKRTLPIAKLINATIIETYEYMETLPNEKAKKEHILAVEKGVKKQYTAEMKKLTLTQGRLLIKLIDRECNQRAYDLVKAFLGGFKATVYNAFASIFRASLKKTYDPEHDADDRLTERVVIMVENGIL